ncbi:hypothetical protein [Streptomyces sp. HNM0575]|uniref:hypothetical protein n=1 Tax=Streptomyces sp. HNM0575 TaxID=2716338 RepID=UPI0019D2FD61|nr:hypothetical protein [Streptomyces sp. HNM0575]
MTPITDTDSAAAPAVDTGSREKTRIVLLFSLSGQVPVAEDGDNRLANRFDFGRFAPHLVNSSPVMPTVAFAERLEPGELELPDGTSSRIAPVSSALVVLTTPRQDATLLLDCEFADGVTHGEVADWLAATCFTRQGMTWSGEPLLAGVTARMGLGLPLEFGLNVHQLVFAGGELRELLLDENAAVTDTGEVCVPPAVSSVVYRGKMQPGSQAQLGVRMPSAMNSPGSALLAHGRGVSVHAGWAPHVENVLALVAATMLTALAVLQRTRLEAFAMLDANQRAVLTSPTDARDLISRLADGANELQLDLAFGVEAYIDSLMLPEMMVEGFQVSLRDALGITDSLEHSSQMVDRLVSVIDARSATLEAALSERDERRERSFSVLIALVTLMSLPPALLLAYFGVNASDIDPEHSILDIRHYGWAYLTAWVPFLLLILVGYWLRRRGTRMTAPAFASRPGGPPVVPAPRSPGTAGSRSPGAGGARSPGTAGSRSPAGSRGPGGPPGPTGAR